MRLRLATLMHQHVNLLILDEPTNHLDIESREVLEEAVEQFDGTVIAVSHDRYFLNQVFDTMYWLENGRVNQYLGNYDEAKQKRAGLARLEEVETKLNKTKVKQIKPPDLSVKQKEIEKKIIETEEQVSRLEDQLYRSNEQDSEQLHAWMDEKQELEDLRALLYDQLDNMLSEEEDAK